MTRFVLIVTITIVCLATPTIAQFNRNWQNRHNCLTPENYYGSCVALSYCPQVTQVFQLTDRRTAQNYVIALQRSCGTRNIGGDPLVCCTRPLSVPVTERTTTTTTTPIPVAEEGGFVPPQPVAYSQTTVPNKNPFHYLLTPTTTTTTTTTTSTTTAAPLRYSGNVVNLNAVIPVNYVTVPRRLPNEEEGCGYSEASSRRIVGGAEAKKGAYPWIALLGYDDGSSSPFKCGGTLITARHIVTAAHCIREDLTFVRLGEHDLSTDTEARHSDIPIVKTAAHPEYNRRNGRSDIAIVYMERNVEFTNLVLPICMPNYPSLRSKSYVDTLPTVAGWGRTIEGGATATVLNELMIPVLDNEVCRRKYAKLKLNFTVDQFDKAILCAGELSAGKDTCQGDSGGPLMTTEGFGRQLRYYLIGVVAYGVGCARSDIPSVYTSTQYFMDWILEKLEDTP